MRIKDLTGQIYGRLTVLELTDKRTKSGNAVWLCGCECGKKKLVPADRLKSGHTRSCGCLTKEVSSKIHKGKPFNSSHNGSAERLYGVWAAMIRRCENPNDGRYKDYGGRGIKVCKEWRENYAAFREYAISCGYDQASEYGKYTIDRIDVNGDYCPENCRWVDMKTQNNNRRNNSLLTYCGRTQTVAQWARETGINSGTLYSRIERGWPPERALVK